MPPFPSLPSLLQEQLWQKTTTETWLATTGWAQPGALEVEPQGRWKRDFPGSPLQGWGTVTSSPCGLRRNRGERSWASGGFKSRTWFCLGSCNGVLPEPSSEAIRDSMLGCVRLWVAWLCNQTRVQMWLPNPNLIFLSICIFISLCRVLVAARRSFCWGT